MKPEEKNVEEILKQHWSSASQEEAEADCNRVLHHLRTAAEHAPKEHRASFGFLSFFGTRMGMVSAAAAVIFVVVLGATMVQRYRAIAVVEKSGATVAMGEVVRGDADGSTLVLTDGSRVEMRAQSELVLERADDGVRIRLNKGDIIVNAAKQHGHLYVQTKDVMVSVVGTVFLVKAEETGSRVAVIEGEVHVKQGETEQKLKPGEQVKTNPLMESQPVSQEIAWSSKAPEHMALLQQSAPVATRGGAGSRLVFDPISIRPHRAATGDGRGGGGGSNLITIGPAAGCAAAQLRIDPTRFAIEDTTIWNLITWAYGPDRRDCMQVTPLNLISGAPGWIKSDKWDIEAVIPEASRLSVQQRFQYGDYVPVLDKVESAKFQRMILSLLEDRLKFVLRRETKEVPAYVLTLEKGASPKFTVAAFPGSPYGAGIDDPNFKKVWDRVPSGSSHDEGGTLSGKDVYMTDLAGLLAARLWKPVVDRTDFNGQFSFILLYNPPNTKNPDWADRPNVFTAVEKQIGLKLEETRTTVETWTIEHIEKPSEN